ncbi:hypothetical protein MBH78_00950 [Oceanimonas sp. NS1]|nr:hypothetical protein [Oceanimonas sp. NS1]
MLLTNPDSMLGQVFAGGRTVLSNRMADDPAGAVFLPGIRPCTTSSGYRSLMMAR